MRTGFIQSDILCGFDACTHIHLGCSRFAFLGFPIGPPKRKRGKVGVMDPNESYTACCKIV